MEAVLQQVKEFAGEAHKGQQRKYTPEPYIVHPVRVMEMCRSYSQELPVLAAALLHDVLEDTRIDKAALTAFLNSIMIEKDASQTADLVIELTDVYIKERYPKWNRKKRKSKEADRIKKTSAQSQTVKYADIIDNCREIVDHDPEFANRFLRECRDLLKCMPKGHPELYRLAIDIVNQSLEKLKNPKQQ
ncbi:MAG TPA: HD domain-containing protein [Flavisolibacter sp.]|nr:HD domain-containing protein [Flavisolibacter sp.]